jgi:hypothetical protein
VNVAQAGAGLDPGQVEDATVWPPFLISFLQDHEMRRLCHHLGRQHIDCPGRIDDAVFTAPPVDVPAGDRKASQ